MRDGRRRHPEPATPRHSTGRPDSHPKARTPSSTFPPAAQPPLVPPRRPTPSPTRCGSRPAPTPWAPRTASPASTTASTSRRPGSRDAARTGGAPQPRPARTSDAMRSSMERPVAIYAAMRRRNFITARAGRNADLLRPGFLLDGFTDLFRAQLRPVRERRTFVAEPGQHGEHGEHGEHGKHDEHHRHRQERRRHSGEGEQQARLDVGFPERLGGRPLAGRGRGAFGSRDR